MKYHYQGEKDSVFPEALWRNTPLEHCGWQLLSLDYFSGPRRNQRFTAHENLEWLSVFRGVGRLVLPDGDTVPLQPGFSVLIPPGVRHFEESEQEMTLIWMGFRGNLTLSAVTLLEQEKLARDVYEFWQSVVGSAQDRPLRLAGKFLLLMDAVDQALRRQTESRQNPLQASLEIMHRQWNHELTIDELARSIHLSRRNFFRKFKQYTRLSPNEYLTMLRVENAKRLLCESTLTVREIGRMCAMDDPYYFSRVFKKCTGVSPSEFRQAKRTP